MNVILDHHFTDSDLHFCTRLYEDSFPVEERRPVLPADKLHIVRRQGEDSPLGFATLWHLPGFCYVEHFAVAPQLRGQGIGSAALGAIPHPTVLEAEPSHSSQQALRRIGFYRRNGFIIASRSYLQPPYSPGLPPVPLYIMVRGGLSIPTADVIRTLHRTVYAR